MGAVGRGHETMDWEYESGAWAGVGDMSREVRGSMPGTVDRGRDARFRSHEVGA